MTAPERIWADFDIFHSQVATFYCQDAPYENGTEYVRADLAAVPAQVRVKPLVWEVFQSKYEGRQHYGRGVFSHWYGVVRQKSGAWNCFHFIDGQRVDLGTHPTLEAAKAAAQADYEAQLPAALEPQNKQCCMCGKLGLSTAEDGGPECELHDGRWVCSRKCYDAACSLMVPPLEPQPDPRDEVITRLVEALEMCPPSSNPQMTDTEHRAAVDVWWRNWSRAALAAAKAVQHG